VVVWSECSGTDEEQAKHFRDFASAGAWEQQCGREQATWDRGRRRRRQAEGQEEAQRVFLKRSNGMYEEGRIY
jgi:hypothetical protein